MSILSLRYFLFFPLMSGFIWLFPGRKRTYTVLIANIIFLILLSSRIADASYVIVLCIWTFFAGEKIAGSRSKKKLAVAAALPVLGLCWYKYAGFFTGRNILMPIGISFYTFKAISYLADVCFARCEEQEFIKVVDYLVFFPVFMAGPINRPAPFFQALEEPWTFSYRDQKLGFVQTMLGAFEKLVIADRLSQGAELFLSSSLSGWYTVFGVLLYAFEIYADFDAYSNMAIGISRMLGFEIERNFNCPYLSASIPEFWHRWHISLSSWLRDYVYIPLGGNRKGEVRKAFNVLAAFLVSGLWHGSSVLFLIWGLGHGVLNVLEGFLRRRWMNHPNIKYFRPLLILINFILVSALWVFFRSASLMEAMDVFARIGAAHGLPSLSYETAGITLNELNWYFILIITVIVLDLLRNQRDMNLWLAKQVFPVRWAVYLCLIVLAVIFGIYGPGYHPEDFIYVTF